MQTAVPSAVLSAVLALCLAAVHAAPPDHPVGECLDASYAGLGGLFPSTFRISPDTTIVNPIPTKVTVAERFTITYFDTYKLLTNLNGDETYALYQCGLPPPTDLPPGTKTFSIPLTSVSASDANGLVFMKLLGVEDRINYVTPYVVDSCLQKIGKYGCNQLDPLDSKNATLIDPVNATVDAFMMYYPDANNTKGIAVTAAADRGVLARAEWIKFVAAFFNKEDVANQVFSNIANAYQTTNSTVRAAVPNTAARPLVAWLLWNPPMFGESVQISLTPYKLQYAEDAGGRSLSNNTVFPIALKYDSKAKFQYDSVIVSNMSAAGAFLREALKDVDIVVEGSQFYAADGSTLPNKDVTLDMILAAYHLDQSDVQTLKFLKNGMVLRQDASSNPDGFTDWFELGVGRPDLVLQELAQAITPSAFPAGTVNAASNKFIRRLVAQPALDLTVQQCTERPTCTVPLSTICPAVYKSCNGKLVAATPEQRCAPTCPATSPTPAPAPTTDGSPAPAPAPTTAAPASPAPASPPLAASFAALPAVLVSVMALLAAVLAVLA